jgi:ATP-dependent Clp protease ATP-binding subunit ClpC
MEKQNIENPLLNYGIDLTQKAREGKLDKVWGREEEILRAVQVLSRRKKNNLVLVGNPGCGKTAIAEMLAQKIADKDIPHILQGKTIFSLDIPSIVAGTQYRGQMEERLKAITNYLAVNPDVIIFIDEIHIIMESNSSNSMSIANILKPYLTNGTIQCIGATTHDEHKKHFEKDAAMSRRFQKLSIDDPSAEVTVKILENCKGQYEDFHQVVYPQEVLNKIPHLAKRFLIDRHLPDSAIDIMDETGAKATIDSMVVPVKITKLEEEIAELNRQKIVMIKDEKWSEIVELKKLAKKCENALAREMVKWEAKRNDNRPVISEMDVLKVISSLSKVPLDKLTSQGLSKIETLKKAFKQLSGQDEAKQAILKALKRSMIGLSNENKPVASFLFMGKTGVGKSQIAKLIAENWFDGSLVRLDMSEFMEKISGSALTGAAPGYVGYDKGGRFEEVRRNPYSVVLFDEIEKAHPEILNTLLQILDDGQITDSSGRLISFRNCIIIMTSNLGAKEVAVKSVGFGAKENKLVEKSLESAKKFFSPEIWNRIDMPVVFEELTPDHISEIVEIELEKVKTRLASKNITLKVSKKVKEFLAEKGYSEAYGARHLSRAVQEYLVDGLTEHLLENDTVQDCSVSVNITDETLTFKLV